MDELAKDTGGQAIYNTNGLADALTRISDASANYYTLSYVPPNAANDGAFHKIQVKLPGNYKLSYRRGYFASDPTAEAASEAKSHRDPLSTFMGPGLPDSTDFALAVRRHSRPLASPVRNAVRGIRGSRSQSRRTPASKTQSLQATIPASAVHSSATRWTSFSPPTACSFSPPPTEAARAKPKSPSSPTISPAAPSTGIERAYQLRNERRPVLRK